jgi:hypothetical protein
VHWIAAGRSVAVAQWSGGKKFDLLDWQREETPMSERGQGRAYVILAACRVVGAGLPALRRVIAWGATHKRKLVR